MGNCCIGSSSAMVWADDDSDENDQWVYYSTPEKDRPIAEKQSLLGNTSVKKENRADSSVSVNGNREVKIKISKKKLKELLGKVEDLKNMPVDQVLARLIDFSDRLDVDDHHHGSWKPNLQSIPEVD